MILHHPSRKDDSKRNDIEGHRAQQKIKHPIQFPTPIHGKQQEHKGKNQDFPANDKYVAGGDFFAFFHVQSSSQIISPLTRITLYPSIILTCLSLCNLLFEQSLDTFFCNQSTSQPPALPHKPSAIPKSLPAHLPILWPHFPMMDR